MKVVLGKHIVEQAKLAGIPVAEEVLHQIQEVIFEKAIPAALQDPEASAAEKGFEGFIVTAYPLLKPQIEKAEDLNGDGKVGV